MRYRIVSFLLAIFQLAIAAGGPGKGKDVPSEGATKLLISSISHLDLKGVQIALRQGADPNLGADYKSPIGVAVSNFIGLDHLEPAERKKTLEMAKYLFSKGARLHNTEDEFFAAIVSRDKSALNLLLEHGLDPYGTYQGYDLIQLAYVHKSDVLIPLLRKRGVADISPRDLPILKLTRAINSFDDKEIQRLLVEEKVDVNEYDPSGRTPLINILKSSIWEYDPTSLGTIIMVGRPNWNLASKNRNDFGMYPLHFITTATANLRDVQIQTVAITIKAAIQNFKADPDVVDNLKCTPLHNAARDNSFKIIETLLQAGANPKVYEFRQRKPSDIATSQDVIRLLRAAESK